MIKSIVLVSLLVVMMNGCSTKEFNDGFDGMTKDVSNLFEEGRDKSAN